jgi:hypothetical protein
MKKYSSIAIFDLDETVIDSKHRTPNFPDGTLNLEAYIKNHTPENVAKDTLLPLAKTFFSVASNPSVYVVICTARDMKPCDYEFLKENGLHANMILSRDKASEKHYKMKDGEYKVTWLKKLRNLKQFRNLPAIMFDDAKPVKSAVRKMGIPVICAHKANKYLHNLGYSV